MTPEKRADMERLLNEARHEKQTAMLLTDMEWRRLANVCQHYLDTVHPMTYGVKDLCNRIIDAAGGE